MVEMATTPHPPAFASHGSGLRGKAFCGITIFASAFLLFQVEPIIAKIILPWFGGVAAVWSVCLLFFQVVLLLGYLYAHWLTQKFQAPVRGRIHCTLIAASFFVLPVLPKDSWKPTGPATPAFHVLLLLTVTVGLPYFLLSATSPLLQSWHSQNVAESRPYRLYAVSNAGSMLGLVSYPFLEPLLTTARQAVAWSWAYAAAGALCGVLVLFPRVKFSPRADSAAAAAPDWKMKLLWMALAACGSTLLLAVTNHISQNIASIPFLWIVPLALYLLSFVLCFAGHSWYHRGIFLRLLGLALGGMAYALAPNIGNLPLAVLLPLFCVGLFICCMVCHGELARLKPHPEWLTSFYVMCALGGAAGALFVALLAPHIFSGYYELPIAIGGCGLLVLIVLRRDPQSVFYRALWRPAWLLLMALEAALIASLYLSTRAQAADVRLMVRNFYGVLRVRDEGGPARVVLEGKTPQTAPDDPRFRKLMNGAIDHGLQFLAPNRRREPTSYYGRSSGVGLALEALRQAGPLHVGVVGLGAGTLAAYGRAGDRYTFYEINPLVIQVARLDFTFLADSPAAIELVPGDGRLSLEREAPQQFDLLAVDAFSGDSIPVHLLTREAFVLYFHHLKADGVLAVHVSNQYLDLQPVVESAAASQNRAALVVHDAGDLSRGIYRSVWVLVGDAARLRRDESLFRAGSLVERPQSVALWTDDYSSLLKILK